jgi:hypothetical protein
MVIKSWQMRWAEHVARRGEIRNMYTVLSGKPKEDDNLGVLRCEGYTKIDLKETTCEDMVRIQLADDTD